MVLSTPHAVMWGFYAPYQDVLRGRIFGCCFKFPRLTARECCIDSMLTTQLKFVMTYVLNYGRLHGPPARSPPRPAACLMSGSFRCSMYGTPLHVYTFKFLFYGVQIETQTQIFFYPFYSVYVSSIACCLHTI